MTYMRMGVEYRQSDASVIPGDKEGVQGVAEIAALLPGCNSSSAGIPNTCQCRRYSLSAH